MSQPWSVWGHARFNFLIWKPESTMLRSCTLLLILLLLNFPLSRANTWKPESTSLGHHYSLRLFCKASCGCFHQNYLHTQLSLAQQDCIDPFGDLMSTKWPHLEHICIEPPLTLGTTSRKKGAVLLDFVQMREGGEGAAQIFCHLFISAFLVNKMSLFPPKCQ